jgi:hypothetical protein
MTRENSANRLSRRDFNKLSMAALGGAISGAFLSGCEGDKKPAPEGTPPSGDVGKGDAPAAAAAEIHACRGLNACKGKGTGGENACAGAGNCATAPAHGCSGSNECKGQGGCGEAPGANACSGKGGCAVPLADHAWGKARTLFEARMKAQGKTVAEAPAKG